MSWNPTQRMKFVRILSQSFQTNAPTAVCSTDVEGIVLGGKVAMDLLPVRTIQYYLKILYTL